MLMCVVSVVSYIYWRSQALQVNDEQMEIFLHPDDKVAQETMQASIEINYIDEPKYILAEDEEWFWIWA
jgi:cbb3-type cytochrome oxidase subunit 3